MIKNLVFDLGDTLISFDYTDLVKNTDIREAEQIRLKMFSSDLWNDFMKSDTMLEKDFIDIYSKNDNEIRVLDSIFNNQKYVIYYPDLYQLINNLKKIGYKIYLLSNYPTECFYKHIKYIPIDFDGIIISGEVGCLKPNKDIYELLLNKYDLKADETLFFDDLKENLEIANELGMSTMSLKLYRPNGINFDN